ncbi:MAG: hypothetical protein WBM02_03235 [bacterium]
MSDLLENQIFKNLEINECFTVIHSAKSRSTCTNAPWIRLTKRILSEHDPDKKILITSAGMLHYDIVLREWMHRGGFSRVILHKEFNDWPENVKGLYSWLVNNPQIEIIQALPSGLTGTSSDRDKKKAYLSRDRLVLQSASIIEVGCVNPNGRMVGLLKAINPQFQTIRRWFLSKEERSSIECYKRSSFQPPDDMGSFNEYIWHFTRARFTPWPDETMVDYLDNLLARGQVAPYSAETVLRRIIEEKRIRSSNYLVRGNHPVVCFSGASWKVAKTLFTWQNHLRRLRFEPFAIGIAKHRLSDLAIHPVIYGSEAEYSILDGEEQWKFQKYDRFSTKWIDEAEWRCKGDLNLSSIGEENLAILVPFSVIKMNTWQ